MEQQAVLDTAGPTACCTATPAPLLQCPLQELANRMVYEAQSSRQHTYSAIEAILGRKDAIRSLQKRLGIPQNVSAVPWHSSTLSESSTGTLVQDSNIASAASALTASNHQAFSLAIAYNKAASDQPQPCGATADCCTTHAQHDASKPSCCCMVEEEGCITAKVCHKLDTVHTAANHTQQPVDAVKTPHVPAEQRNRIPAARRLANDSSQLYAAEFDRIRRRHQQRTAAALVIQAAVRRWLASRHRRSTHQAPQQQQQQNATETNQSPQQLRSLCDARCRPVGQDEICTHSRSEQSCIGADHDILCPAAAGSLSGWKAPFAAGTAIHSGQELQYRWRWYRKSVGLRCRQLLRSEGPFAMAAAYHRLRVQAAVLLWWRAAAAGGLQGD